MFLLIAQQECRVECLHYSAAGRYCLAAVLQILTGFLGSGKTTLLNNVLSKNHGRRIAIIENEVCLLELLWSA